MSVYKYIADSDPNNTKMVIESFGYEITDSRNLGKSLAELIHNVGEPALKKAMEIHPDKDIILEYFGSEKQGATCSCASCSKNKEHHYLNASGNETATSGSQTNTHTMAQQTNVIIGVSALLIIAGLLLKNR